MIATLSTTAVAVEQMTTSVYTIPTDSPESDGTYQWDLTTLVLVEMQAGGQSAVGFSYADRATAELIRTKLTDVVVGRDALAIADAWIAMVQTIRNLGRPGIASMAIAAVDAALWDLKAKLLVLSLVSLLGAVRPSVPSQTAERYLKTTPNPRCRSPATG